jgi:hypothetical protein
MIALNILQLDTMSLEEKKWKGIKVNHVLSHYKKKGVLQLALQFNF